MEQRPLDVVPVGVFSEMDSSQALPDGWKPVALAASYEKTTYELVDSDRGPVVRARSEGGSSVLGTRCRVDPATHPILEWHWKVERVFDEANVDASSRNDAPARIIVSFDYNDLRLAYRLKIIAVRALGYDIVPRRALVYLWTNQEKDYTVTENPFLPWTKQIPVQSGSTDVGTWQTERRNVLADYRRAYGDEDPPPVEGIAFQTDTNDLNEPVTTWYGDIVFRGGAPDSTTVDTTHHP